MLRVQARPSSGDSDNDIDAAGKTYEWRITYFKYQQGYFMVCIFFTVAREDLANLQRQFRLTEGSRKQYADQATNTLRKQR